MVIYSRSFRKILKILAICAGILVLLLIAFFFMVECGGKWSEEKRKKFAEECASTTTIDRLDFSLVGFNYHEIDTIAIKQIHKNICIDSFLVFVAEERNQYDVDRNAYWAQFDKSIQITDTYHVIVPNVQTFVLSDMEMVMWAQYTMMSEGWGCIMGNYTIDTVRFEHDSHPTFVRKDYERK